MVSLWHEYQITGRHRQLRCKPRALAAYGILGHLDDDFFTIVEIVNDSIGLASAVLPAIAIEWNNVRYVNKSRALCVNVNERRLHSR